MSDIKPTHPYIDFPPVPYAEAIPIDPNGLTGYDVPPQPDLPRADTQPIQLARNCNEVPPYPVPLKDSDVPPRPWKADPWPPGMNASVEGLPPEPYRAVEQDPPGPLVAEILPPTPYAA